jgi:hypothetical protein
MSFDLASAAAATGVAKSSVLRAIKAGNEGPGLLSNQRN